MYLCIQKIKIKILRDILNSDEVGMHHFDLLAGDGVQHHHLIHGAQLDPGEPEDMNTDVCVLAIVSRSRVWIFI